MAKTDRKVKLSERVSEIQMQMLSMSKQLEESLEKNDEKRILELTKTSDQLTAEYCAILGFAMDSSGKLDQEKLNTTLSDDVIKKQAEKAEQNPVYQWMKADTSAPQALKNMNNIGNMTPENFARQTAGEYANEQLHGQQKVDAQVDEILKKMGFDPATLRAESAKAWAEMPAASLRQESADEGVRMPTAMQRLQL